jgi:hypothetical protein
VSGFRVVAFDNQRHEIQFGSFLKEKSALALLASLSEKDVRTARVEPRVPPPAQVDIEVFAPKAALSAKLADPLFAGIASQACPEPRP